MNNWGFLAVAIAAEIAATSALKASEGFTRVLPALISIAGYGCSFYALSMSLRSIPLGLAYAVWSGVGIAALSLIGWLAFRQPLSASQIGGLVLIIAGVALLRGPG